ncbi:hypothetical protein AB3662_12040 [Sorangium cellulosum]|uniref:hypothetical protein n=1 Tax=Sorangium cellulosum TaxID=56 RepID=UPI003D9A8291
MSACATIDLAGGRASYEAGEEIAGVVRLTTLPGRPVPRVELSVLWQTEGKGSTDTGVAHAQVLTEGQQEAPAEGFPFRARLPLLPRSYRGDLIEIRWSVRVRCSAGFMRDDLIYDQPITVR